MGMETLSSRLQTDTLLREILSLHTAYVYSMGTSAIYKHYIDNQLLHKNIHLCWTQRNILPSEVGPLQKD